MPFFDTELNRLANDTSSADLLVFLHTSAPTNASPANGRITTGGGLYESGATLDSTDITAAANGDVSNSVSIPFGTVDENVGLPYPLEHLPQRFAPCLQHPARRWRGQHRRHLYHQRWVYAVQRRKHVGRRLVDANWFSSMPNRLRRGPSVRSLLLLEVRRWRA